VPDRARAWRRRKVLTDVLLVEVAETSDFHIVKVVFFPEGYDHTAMKSTVSSKDFDS
jgi:hypothetical protein